MLLSKYISKRGCPEIGHTGDMTFQSLEIEKGKAETTQCTRRQANMLGNIIQKHKKQCLQKIQSI